MQGMWQGYVNDHLLPRLHGFELLMASYAVAHLKLDMLLEQTGFNHAENKKRLKIYLTNSLEECHPNTGSLWAQWLSDEASAANRIKRDCPVMVMIGNPPYSGESQNKGEWIMHLMEDYKKEPGGETQLKERNPKWINDDYVKFIRLAQYYIERNECGVIGFINPHGFLDNPTFRGMRWNLLKTFDKIYTINLHGNNKKKEVCPDGSPDENVFDIQQGVSINMFIKTGEKKAKELGKVYYYDLYGKREEKYDFLTNTLFSEVEYKELNPIAPMYFFVPKDFELMEEYEKGVKVNDLFSLGSMGITTGRDKEMVSIQPFKSVNNLPYCYRPFDTQWIDYDVERIARARENVMSHLKKANIALCLIKVNSSSDGLFKVLVSSNLTDKTILSSKDNANVFPLYLYTNEFGKETKVANLNDEEWQKFNNAIGRVAPPEELLAYIYAVLHSPSYRERYKEFLKVDFPRIPLPTSESEFVRLVQIGHQLIDLHMMRNTQSWKCDTTFPEPGSQQIDMLKWKDKKVWINKQQYFGNVPEEVWDFYIGGYQPAQKWLKDRKGRTLVFDDIKHYLYIIHALAETIKLMQKI